MRKVKITITGKEVHGVGYRSVLINKALELGIDRFNTFNTYRDDLQAVVVLIEGDKEQLDEFMDFVQTKQPERAVVSKIIDEEYGKTVPPIERCIQSFQMGQWVEGIPILLDIRDVLKSVKEDTSMIKEDTGKILEKQDMMLEKQDSLKDAVERGFSELKDEHIKTREMSMEIFRSEVQVLREEIDSLRSSVEEIRRKVGIA